MAKNDKTVHSKIIAAAARRVLRPMRLQQQGRSRTWLDDQGWWLGVVEFQPSSWCRGSYLNVGCMWLWYVHDYMSFDEGGRVTEAGFIEFQDENSFEVAALKMAEQAAQEVARFRQLFPSVAALTKSFLGDTPKSFWKNYHAAIACGLTGRFDEANRFFDIGLNKAGNEGDWVSSVCDDIRHLKSLLTRPADFCAVVADRTQQSRGLFKLKPMSVNLVDAASS